MRFTDLSIRRKLVVVTLSTCVFALFLACLGLAIYERARFRDSMVNELSTLADTLGANTAASIAFNDQRTAQEMLSSLRNERQILAAYLYDEHARVFAEYRRDTVNREFPVPPWRHDGVEFGKQTVTLYRSVFLNGENTGSIAIVSDLSSFNTQLWKYINIALVVLLLSLLPTLLVSSRLLRVVSDPILQLSEAAERISLREDYSLRVMVNRRDELGKLMAAFNRMLDRLQQRDSALRDANDHLEARVQWRTAQLSASNQRLTLHRDLSPLAVIEWNGNLQVTDWNPAAERIFGYSREEAMGQHGVELLLPAPARERVNQVWGELLTSPGTTQNTEENITQDGRTILCEWYNTALVGPSGEVIGLASLVQDVTEARHLQEQLRQSQKMEAVGRLAGGVAHDFNNVLMIISSYAELLREDLESHNERLYKMACEVHHAALRGASLTQQLLAFSRKQTLMPEVLNLNSVLFNLRKLLHRLIGEDVELITAPGAALGRVKVDRSQIEQALMNFAVNSRDAMPKGGKLTIETANVQVDENSAGSVPTSVKPGPYVMLAVTDTGAGMDKETQARIFEPFFTTKARGKGTGLGLSIVYGFVTQSGGYIWVDSEPGKGSTFTMYFPIVQEPLPEPAPSDEVARTLQRGTETILLVEDEDGVRESLREFLDGMGYAVLEASKPADALDSASNYQGPIHLLLTDIVMPGLTGRELAERIETARPEIRVLFMSGYTDKTVITNRQLQSGKAFIQKPFALELLAVKLRELLDSPQRSLLN